MIYKCRRKDKFYLSQAWLYGHLVLLKNRFLVIYIYPRKRYNGTEKFSEVLVWNKKIGTKNKKFPHRKRWN